MNHNSGRTKSSTSGNENYTRGAEIDQQGFDNCKLQSNQNTLNTQDNSRTLIRAEGEDRNELSSAGTLTEIVNTISSSSSERLDSGYIIQQRMGLINHGKTKSDFSSSQQQEESSCIACFPPLGGSLALAMGNSGSSPCTCKVAKKSITQEKNVSNNVSRNNDVKRAVRKGKAGNKNRSMDESLSDVFQKLQLSPNSSTKENDIIDVPRHVLYYGWFFDTEVSASLKAISDFYLTECLEVKKFERFMQSNLRQHLLQDPFEYYKKPAKRKQRDEVKYHITAKFCDREQCLPYQENVQNFIGKQFKMHIIGLFFSEKTFGMRIKLTPSQKSLFDERRRSVGVNVDCDSEGASSSHSKTFDRKNLAAVYEMEQKENYFKDHKCKSDVHSVYPGINLVRQNEDFHPTDSRAHITVGCAPKINAVQAGEDLLEILDFEIRQAVFHQDFQIQGATLRQFGRNADAFVIYPHHEIIASATFDVFI